MVEVVTEARDVVLGQPGGDLPACTRSVRPRPHRKRTRPIAPWSQYYRALAAPAAALLGFSALGFLLGSCTRGAASALGLAVGALLGLDLARVVARGFDAERWLLTAYLPSPLGDASYLHYFADRAEGISNSVFDLGSSWAGVPQDFAYPLCWFVACIALSAILLARRAVP